MICVNDIGDAYLLDLPTTFGWEVPDGRGRLRLHPLIRGQSLGHGSVEDAYLLGSEAKLLAAK
jgi:hypothetical protein